MKEMQAHAVSYTHCGSKVRSYNTEWRSNVVCLFSMTSNLYFTPYSFFKVCSHALVPPYYIPRQLYSKITYMYLRSHAFGGHHNHPVQCIQYDTDIVII